MTRYCSDFVVLFSGSPAESCFVDGPEMGGRYVTADGGICVVLFFSVVYLVYHMEGHGNMQAS